MKSTASSGRDRICAASTAVPSTGIFKMRLKSAVSSASPTTSIMKITSTGIERFTTKRMVDAWEERRSWRLDLARLARFAQREQGPVESESLVDEFVWILRVLVAA